MFEPNHLNIVLLGHVVVGLSNYHQHQPLILCQVEVILVLFEEIQTQNYNALQIFLFSHHNYYDTTQ